MPEFRHWDDFLIMHAQVTLNLSLIPIKAWQCTQLMEEPTYKFDDWSDHEQPQN